VNEIAPIADRLPSNAAAQVVSSDAAYLLWREFPGEGLAMPATFRVDDDVLIMTLEGPYSLQDSFSAQAESAQFQRAHNIRSILVDMRNAHFELSTIELFDFCVSFHDAFFPGTRHAVLYSTDSNSISDAEFVENVARNRGIIMKMFNVHDEAQAWLRRDPMQSRLK
jgi:hypothetical protein